MRQRWLLIVLLLAVVGCSSSSKTLGHADTTTSTTRITRHDQTTVAIALCKLPTTSQLSGILGAPVSKTRPGKANTGGGIWAPRCILTAGRTQLAIAVFTFSDTASMR